MSIYTNEPLDLAFLRETKMSVPLGWAALQGFLQSDAFKTALIAALGNDDFGCCAAHDDIVNDREHIADVAIGRLLSRSR